MGRIVDEKATKAARERHEIGVKVLAYFFQTVPTPVPPPGKRGPVRGGRPRDWSTGVLPKPTKARRRKLRKIARESRRRNRARS